MSDKTEPYTRLRRIFGITFLVAALGAGLAFSVGDNMDSPVGNIAAMIVMGAIAVGFVLVPIGVWLAFAISRENVRRARRGDPQGQDPVTR